MNPAGGVIVIGGGISGLTAAFWLHHWGVPVTVLEAGEHPGGTMQTERDAGWLIETGPNSALETTPLFGTMFGFLGLDEERIYADPASNKRYILRAGDLHPLPMSPMAFLRTRLWTPSGKLRILREPFIGRGIGEETIAGFVERRLGREMLDYAINPFVAGVYAGDPAQLSVRAAFPKLYALEERYGGLIRGMIGGARERKRRAEKAKDRARMFSFRSGMQAFPEAIGRFLGERFLPGCKVESVAPVAPGDSRGGFTVTYSQNGGRATLPARAVILAIPAHPAASLLAPLDAQLAAGLEEIYYPPVAEVFLGFRRDQIARPLDGFGYLIPAKEGRSILGTIWSSTIFPGRAPDGHAAFTTFVGGSRQPELFSMDDAELRRMVVAELASIMGVRGAPVRERIIRWPRAIPQYTLGYLDHYRRMEEFERRHPGFLICGNFRGGIAVGDCVMTGEKTARRMKEFLDSIKDH